MLYDDMSDPAVSFGIFADQPLNPTLYTGFNIDYHKMDFETNESNIIEISLSLKGVIPRHRKGFVFRPGASVGYGYLKELSTLNNLHFLMVRGFIEFICFSNEHTGFLLDLGITGSPLGGTKSHRVTMSLRPLIRLGVIF